MNDNLIINYDDFDGLRKLFFENDERTRPILFIGSGLIASFGLPTWQELADCLLNEASKGDNSICGADRERLREKDFQPKDVISFISSKKGPDWVNAEIYKRMSNQNPHMIEEGVKKIHGFLELVNTFKPYIVTTNVDVILEKVLDRRTVLLGEGESCYLSDNNVVHIHGVCEDGKLAHPVFTHGDYGGLYTSQPCREWLQKNLTRPIVFIGYSLSDFEIADIIQSTRVHGETRHFSIVPYYEYQSVDRQIQKIRLNSLGIVPIFYRLDECGYGGLDKLMSVIVDDYKLYLSSDRDIDLVDAVKSQDSLLAYLEGAKRAEFQKRKAVDLFLRKNKASEREVFAKWMKN